MADHLDLDVVLKMAEEVLQLRDHRLEMAETRQETAVQLEHGLARNDVYLLPAAYDRHVNRVVQDSLSPLNPCRRRSRSGAPRAA